MNASSVISQARWTGLLYLVVVLTGVFSIAYVPSQTIVSGDGAATLQRISSSELMFRLGIAAGFVCYLAFLLLPFAFYRLLSHVSRRAAMLMVILAVIGVPVSLSNLSHKLHVLTLLSGKPYLSALAPAQLQAEVMLSLAQYNSGILIAELFWGLWLLPLGYLVFRSRMLPRLLGILLMVGCFGYLADVFATTVLPSYPASGIAAFATRPASLGEIGTCLWLIIFGAKHDPGASANNSSERTARTAQHASV